MNCKEPHICRCKCLIFALLFSASIFFYPNRTRGGEFKIIPFLNLKQEYNDNILLNEDQINDIITTLSPGFELMERTERLDSDFSGQIDKIIYSENNELDALDYYCRANVGYRLNERANIDSQASYKKDSRSDRDIEETGLVLGTSTREQYGYILSGDYQFSEKTGGVLSFVYDQEADQSSEDAEKRSVGMDIEFNHHLDDYIPLLMGRMNTGYTRYDLAGLLAENYSLTVGITHKFDELLNFIIDFGARYTPQKDEIFDKAIDDSIFTSETYETYAAICKMALKHKTDSRTIILDLSRDFNYVSEEYGTTERTALLMRINQKYTDKFQWGLSAQYFLNQADLKENGPDDKQTLRIRFWIRHDFTRDISLQTSYTFTAMNEGEDTNVNQNVIFIRLTYQLPLFE